MTVARLVPELAVADPASATASLCGVFGFRSGAGEGRLHLGNQQVQLRQSGQPCGHGIIDHLALAVADVDAALAAMRQRGAVLDAAVTPDGPLFIPEFWDSGIRYVFLVGPEGARIELCARPGASGAGLPGHDHVGIACNDLAAMADFFRGLGFHDIASTTLIRAAGNVPVAFLSSGGSMVELYAPPGGTQAAGNPLWRRLILEGSDRMEDVAGPEGVLVALRP